MQLLSMDASPVAFVGGFYGRMLSTTPDQTQMVWSLLYPPRAYDSYEFATTY